MNNPQFNWLVVVVGRDLPTNTNTYTEGMENRDVYNKHIQFDSIQWLETNIPIVFRRIVNWHNWFEQIIEIELNNLCFFSDHVCMPM